MLVKGVNFDLDVRSESCCIYRNDTLKCEWSTTIENWKQDGILTPQEKMVAAAKLKHKEMNK